MDSLRDISATSMGKPVTVSLFPWGETIAVQSAKRQQGTQMSRIDLASFENDREKRLGTSTSIDVDRCVKLHKTSIQTAQYL
jgi:hypothetical protein